MSEQREQQLGEEERLLEAITAQREMIDAFAVDDADERAPQQRKLGQLEFKYQLLVEKKRLSSVLAKLEREHGALHSEPCLLCLDDIHVYASESLMEFFFCCGGFICRTCARDARVSGLAFDKCPLCREPLGDKTEAESATQLMALAERGVALAQTQVGKFMIEGKQGFKRKEKAGLKWLNKAAAQNHPRALYHLSNFHYTGLASVVRKSQLKSNELMLKAANLGHAPANAVLASSYFGGSNGFEKDLVEAYFRDSVAFALNENNQAAELMGYLHYYEKIPDPSPYLACYYLNIAAANENAGYCYLYSLALRKLSEHLHGGHAEISGYNVAPAMLFWLRKSHDLGDSDALEQIKELETEGQSYCANCSKEAKAGEKFKQCSKCKAQWYCSKECQVEAWKAGHKKDCKRAGILKFEDYLNTD